MKFRVVVTPPSIYQIIFTPMPSAKISYVDAAIIAAQALTEALANPAPATPFAQFGNAQQQAIIELAKIFESAIAKPVLPSIVPQ